jgi:Ca2+-binding EF-hand superfamily protein
MKKLLIVLGLCALPAAAFAQPSAESMAARLGEADADHDGAVTKDELLQYRAKQFARLDRNGDGVITAEDRPRLAAGRNGRPSLFDQFDVNKDGKIDRAEFVDGPTPVFDKADSNGDGVLSADELKAARETLKAAKEAQ